MENKIPPPIVGLVCAALMWGLDSIAPTEDFGGAMRIPLALLFLVAGVAFAASGGISFRKASTTVNPLKPESATSLVDSGVFRYSRNPMYVGMVLCLTGWAVALSSVLAILGIVAFILFIGRFQILPEERALKELFGAEFEDYCARVRRWI